MIVNYLLKYAGHLYVEQDILRKESDKLLDELDEGIILLDKNSMQPVYLNKVASKKKFTFSCQNNTEEQ